MNCTCTQEDAPEGHVWLDLDCPLHGEFSDVGRDLPPGSGLAIVFVVFLAFWIVVGLAVWLL